MRKIINLNSEWVFTYKDGTVNNVNIPHTWNAADGQDGGNDYFRGVCKYEKDFEKPAVSENECVYIQFHGVNASANVTLNGKKVCTHDGGYSTFRADITKLLEHRNKLTVEVDNSVNDRVYPQKADFTFYGGIYRDVELLVVNKKHFDLDYYGGNGIKYTCDVNGDDATVNVTCYAEGDVHVSLVDAKGDTVVQANGNNVKLSVPDAHLWNGIYDPYLYTLKAELFENGTKTDEVSTVCGIRTFEFSSENGFYLNGKKYPLRGVSRHQDRRELGNALTNEHMEEDIGLIREMGANTVRLAHYQHNRYFYDLCDKYGLVVWAEIPYISSHMERGRENTLSQMKELIVQNYNHPSIITWGISNEITISTKNKKDMLDNHRVLQQLCHQMDSTRPTTLACYAMCSPFNPVSKITDLVGWNLYLGWYVPGLFLNDLWIGFYHLCHPNRCLGFSEYGAEGMPNLHSSHPRRGDHSEEYQAIYHEYMLRCFERHPYMWGNYVWNMFDFAADARDQGGEPGMNHKGLVTFDRTIKKDSFYLYKAYWSEIPFVHICSKRYVNRSENKTLIKVYSNSDTVTLYANGKKIAQKQGKKVFEFKVPLKCNTEFRAVSGDCSDVITVNKVEKKDSSYKLNAKSSNSANWV